MVAFALVLLCPLVAMADATITNFNGGGTGAGNQITQRDVQGNYIDAHDGQLFQDPQNTSKIYLIGTSYACGFRWQITSTFCGFKIYDYSDLTNAVLIGYLFDATTGAWQTHCAGVGANNRGCFRPHVIYNAANNNYVIWFNQVIPEAGQADGYFVFTCTSLNPPSCTQQTSPSGLAHSPGGDFSLFVDPATSIGYIAYNVSNTVYVDKLNAAYTDSTGTSSSVATATGEALSMFAQGGTYYLTYTGSCGFCTGTATNYVAASSPQGTYSSSTQLNANSCGGQNRSTDIVTAGGHTTYLYSSDLWIGQQNEGYANSYYQPLTISGGSITAFPCNTTVTVPGVTVSTYPTPNNYPLHSAFDQNDIADGITVFNDRSDIDATHWAMQTFVPTSSALYGVATPVGQNALFSSSFCQVGGSNCPGTNGTLEMDLVTVDGSNNPVTTLASATVSPSNLPWSANWLTFVFNYTGLTPSSTYAFVLKGVGTTQQTFMRSVSRATNAYPSGIERSSSNSGSSWTTDTNFSFIFATIPTGPVAAPMGGLAANDNDLTVGEKRRVAAQ